MWQFSQKNFWKILKSAYFYLKHQKMQKKKFLIQGWCDSLSCIWGNKTKRFRFAAFSWSTWPTLIAISARSEQYAPFFTPIVLYKFSDKWPVVAELKLAMSHNEWILWFQIQLCHERTLLACMRHLVNESYPQILERCSLCELSQTYHGIFFIFKHPKFVSLYHLTLNFQAVSPWLETPDKLFLFTCFRHVLLPGLPLWNDSTRRRSNSMCGYEMSSIMEPGKVRRVWILSQVRYVSDVKVGCEGHHTR